MFSHGVEYVNWPKLNPPVDAIFYEGPGYKTGPHGRGRVFSKLIPWAKINVLGAMRRMPVLHRVEEMEMGKMD